ncbi:MAG: NFACT RNA binding domain-containing protein [Treponema sp.]|nr:NFACT RNA binding domain-containing protein [Treponema sp.]
MSLNCNELNLIISELSLTGAFIQEIVQPSYDMLAFRTIKQGILSTLIICTGANACRINTTENKVPKNVKPLRFHEFLRSHVQGMRINDCHQIGLDRIVKLDVSTWQQKYYIYIRLWSGAANVIVTDEEGIIQDCMYRRPKKNEVTGTKFTVEEKEVSEEEKTLALEKFPIRTFDSSIDSSLSFNRKIDIFYSEHASVLSRESLLAQAEKWYNVKHSKMENALQKLLAKQKQFENADHLKHTGDLILSFGSQAQGNFLDCVDYDTNEQVHIILDAKKSIQENATAYYDQYKKAISGLEDLQHDIDLSKRNIAALDAEYKAILDQKNVIKIEQMLRHDTTPKQKVEKVHAGLHYEVDGWTIIVGRTASENDDLLRHTVKGSDMWLHTRDYAGGYVFIKAQKNKTVPLEILLYAGNLAVYHSKARRNGQADLYYTHVKYLRRAKNGPKGLVLPTQEKNLFVKLDENRLRRLDELEKARIGI